jgi:hypothetical protein
MGSWGREGYGRVSSIALQRVKARDGGLSLHSNGRAPSDSPGLSNHTSARELGRREGPPVEPSLRSSPDSDAEDTERARERGPHRASVGSTALVRAVGRVCNRISRVGPEYILPSLRRAPVHQFGVEAHDSRDGSAAKWQASIRETLLTLAGPSASGGAAAAAELLARHCWSANAWATRSSQWRKIESFCEEDNRTSLPATERDIVAYIGYLRLDIRVSAASLPQCLSEISRFHELPVCRLPPERQWSGH